MKTYGLMVSQRVIDDFNLLIETGAIHGLAWHEVEERIFMQVDRDEANAHLKESSRYTGYRHHDFTIKTTDKLLAAASKRGEIHYNRRQKCWLLQTKTTRQDE